MNNLDYQDVGRSVYDVGEDEIRERTYYYCTRKSDYPGVLKSRRQSGANVANKYVYYEHVDNVDMENPTEIIPLKDSLY